MKVAVNLQAAKILSGVLCSLAFTAVLSHGNDWPQYRGPNHNGVSTDRIQQQWPEEGPRALWRVPCTNGPASLTVSDGRVFTQIRRDDGGGDREVCIALDAGTGAELWASSVGLAQYDGGVGLDDGPRSTPSVYDGRVFVLSSHLVLHCLNASNGAGIWSRDLRALYGGTVIGWQNSASPVVENGLIFVNCNAASQSLLALRTGDGSLAWRSENARLTHSTPVTATIQGIAQVIFASQSGLVSLDCATGAVLWRSPHPFYYETSLAASPVVSGNIVFITANYSMGAYAVRIASSNSTLVATLAWANPTYKAHWMTPVCHQGYLYGMFGSILTAPLKCIDLQTGVQKWSMSGFGRGGTLLVDNQLVVLSERGDLVLIEPNPSAYTEKARFTLFPGYDPDTNKCWNVPAVSKGRIYARSTAEVVCLDVSISSLSLSLGSSQGAELQLWVGTDTGAPIDLERMLKMELRWTTSLVDPLPAWSRLTNNLVLTNGQVRVDGVKMGEAAFYIATEAP